MDAPSTCCLDSPHRTDAAARIRRPVCRAARGCAKMLDRIRLLQRGSRQRGRRQTGGCGGSIRGGCSSARRHAGRPGMATFRRGGSDPTPLRLGNCSHRNGPTNWDRGRRRSRALRHAPQSLLRRTVLRRRRLRRYGPRRIADERCVARNDGQRRAVRSSCARPFEAAAARVTRTLPDRRRPVVPTGSESRFPDMRRKRPFSMVSVCSGNQTSRSRRTSPTRADPARPVRRGTDRDRTPRR